jgi:hypothetical protein
MTLIEILITTVVALILLYSIMRIFSYVSGHVARGRAALEMSGQIRATAHRLREDLRGLTVPIRPWPRSSSAEGYFEYLEGAERDTTNLAADTTIGDRDDVLAFTARSVEEPYVGRFNGNPIESQAAEIVWWAQPDSIGTHSLRRRVLLIRPDLNTNNGTLPPAFPGTGPADLQTFYNTNDVSVRLSGNGGLIANTLADLTKRENRFAHITAPVTAAFAFPLDASTPGNPTSLVNLAQTGTQQGDDVILSHVKAFDVRAFDPAASIRTDGNRALIPSDPGWAAAVNAGNAEIGRGAFVDLNYNVVGSPNFIAGLSTFFSGPPHVRSGMSALVPAGTSVYDTWSFHYEHDGIDQDGNGIADQGTNGFDDNNQNGPDDVLERETSPPYPVPLRGIQIKIRIYDADSHQVREATVTHDFIPE